MGNPRDATGNIINEGDFVHLKLDDPWVIARIVEIKDTQITIPVTGTGPLKSESPMTIPSTFKAYIEIDGRYASDRPIPVMLKLAKQPEPVKHQTN
jgi:hypothetical protein